MKTLEEIKDEVSKTFGYKDFKDAKKKAYLSNDLVYALDMVCNIYAVEKVAAERDRLSKTPSDEEIEDEARRYNAQNIEYMRAQDFALHMINWFKRVNNV